MPYDVFISYSSDDQKIVEGLSAYLEQHGVRCFVAYRDIPKGTVWAEKITEAIENSKLMVVVFSEHFNNSKQVDREIEMSIEEGKPILTFKIQNTDFKGTKKYFLINLNWINAFPNPKEYFGELLNSIQNLLPETKKEEINQKTDKRETGKINEKNKNFLIYAGILVGIVFLCTFGFLYLKNKSNEPIVDKPVNKAIENVNKQPVENKTDTVVVYKNNEQQPATVTEPVKPNSSRTTKPEDVSVPESKSITFTEKKILVSTSGEQFEVNKGDSLEGIFDNGKVVSGKLYDKDKNVKRIIFPKRNH